MAIAELLSLHMYHGQIDSFIQISKKKISLAQTGPPPPWTRDGHPAA